MKEKEERMGIIQTQRERIPVNLDEFEEVKRLEIRHQTGLILLRQPELSQTDRMLLRWMTGTLIRSDTSESALENWHELRTSRGRGDRGFTASQKRELSISDDVVRKLHAEVHSYMISSQTGLNETVATQIADKYGHRWNDAYEAKQTPKRSLEVLKDQGMRISIPSEYKSLLVREYEKNEICPILDKVKNTRMVTINGFDNSKTSLTIHDIFDHFWFYAKLEETGILNNYSDFLNQVGNPQNTDIFSREGELIASVAFDYRSKTVSEIEYQPLFNLVQIERVFKHSERAGTLTQNQKKAWEYLKTIDPNSQEGKGLTFVVSGISIELMEQRRKNGFIRVLTNDFKPKSVLSILDPEYVALIVESHGILYKSETETDKTLLYISTMVEDYLIRVVGNEPQEDLILSLDSIKKFDPTKSRVSVKRFQWMKDHLGFTANRRELC
ncbi:MAG TPA: hypothetical protein VKC53_04435 [Patescibacteria group bacterium]|nr:hypothetical protein [Patescibacteria group bacterium]